jgi:hypothetical protein
MRVKISVWRFVIVLFIKKQEIYRMYYVRQMSLLLSITSVLFLLFGLTKPWLLLWWEDTQNRRKVIRVYGSVAIIFYLIYWGLSLMPIV